MSEKSGRVFGRYKTKAEAQKRLRQVEFFNTPKENEKSATHLLAEPIFLLYLKI